MLIGFIDNFQLDIAIVKEYPVADINIFEKKFVVCGKTFYSSFGKVKFTTFLPHYFTTFTTCALDTGGSSGSGVQINR